MIASLPMYDWPEVQEANDGFWNILQAELIQAGFKPPAELSRDDRADDQWLDRDLLFSQTCGYPFATRLCGRVNLLTTPVYSVEGCEGPTYSSAIIVRRDDDVSSLTDALDGTLAFNGEDSLSGYRCFAPLIGDPVTAFASSLDSGGHRHSALMVASGEADCAAIDAVCWDLFKRFEPQAAELLCVLQWGPSFPALPYITTATWSATELEQVRLAVSRGIEKAATGPQCSDLRLAGCEQLGEPDYASLKEL